jgi:hypothetical protein
MSVRRLEREVLHHLRVRRLRCVAAVALHAEGEVDVEAERALPGRPVIPALAPTTSLAPAPAAPEAPPLGPAHSAGPRLLHLLLLELRVAELALRPLRGSLSVRCVWRNRHHSP